MAATESLLCNSCGAPLQVPANANYVKCNHCQTQLHVKRSADATFTESIEQLNQTTGDLRDQITRLNRQQKISDLDRQWELRREDFMVTGENGHRSLPTEDTALFGGVVVVVFGIFWMVMACGITSGSPFKAAGVFPLFGLIFIAAGVFGAVNASVKAKEYKKAELKYWKERRELAVKDKSKS